MKQQKLVNILGYVILLGICFIGFFAVSIPIVSSYIFLLFCVGCFRIHLWSKIPKEARHVYSSWRTAILLHPVAQIGLIIFFIFVDIIVILTRIGMPL